ncbi:MAG: PTS sugar transporter subunit IIC [Gemmatimonadaceae bacterium]|nr:PTS sugar transporter subunit IIC [Gemmatimonadaceae bacterium]
MTFADMAIIALLGAVLGLDTVSFPQAMYSRPIVACTVTAGLLGAAPAGLLLGALVEAFALETLPVGAARYPEWGSSSAVGGALVATSPQFTAGSMLTAVVATVLMAWLGGWSMVQLRRLNARWAHQRQAFVNAGSRRDVIGLQLYGISADLLRGAVMTVVGLLVFAPLYARSLETWGIGLGATRLLLISLAGVAAVGAVYKVFHATPRTGWYFLLGLGLGLLVLVLR